MNTFQTNINALVSALYEMGLRHSVICPGSRNAPLVMSLNRHSGISTYSVVDERSAAFMALGMAKQCKQPVAVCCTSGSAVVNMYPAVVEAYYSQIPLLLLTADRPPELIDRWDGQAIHQFEVFKPHIKASYQTSAKLDMVYEAELFKIGVAAYRAALKGKHGPVHINMPFAEPLYEEAHKQFFYPKFRIRPEIPVKKPFEFPQLPAAISQMKVLFLHGASEADEANDEAFKNLIQGRAIPVLSDIISGKHGLSSFPNWESVLLRAREDQIKQVLPDLLISSGKMILNKTWKQALKKNPPRYHWHISENGYCPDVYNSKPRVLVIKESEFYDRLAKELPEINPAYFLKWKSLAEQSAALEPVWPSSPFNELQAVKTVLNKLGSNKLHLHLANSMLIRLVAYQAEACAAQWQIHSNRGVSGIDGCSSTALGMALLNKENHVLMSGDLAFFYDINAFLNNYRPPNLKIIVFNNRGGGIFKHIEGAKDMPETDPFLSTPHQLDCKLLAAHFKLNYFSASDFTALNEELENFLQAKSLSILEICTEQHVNSQTFNLYKSINI